MKSRAGFSKRRFDFVKRRFTIDAIEEVLSAAQKTKAAKGFRIIITLKQHNLRAYDVCEPIWGEKLLESKDLLQKLETVQRLYTLGMISGYLTVSTAASAMLARILHIQLLLKEQLYTHSGLKEKTASDVCRLKVAVR